MPSGTACDSDVGSSGFQADGVCVCTSGTCSSNSDSAVCDTGAVYYDDESGNYFENYNDLLSYDYDFDTTGDSCDSDVNPGFSRNGMWIHSEGDYDSGHCDAFGGTVRIDASQFNYYVAGCDTSGDRCDSSTANSNDPWTQDGLCADTGSGGACVTSGWICYDGSSYFSQADADGNCDFLDRCDTNPANGAFAYNGYYSYLNCDATVGCTTDATANACCIGSGSCVSGSTCYTSGESVFDVDGNGDSDYCYARTWYDCEDTADCDPAGEYASGESNNACSGSSDCSETCSSNECVYKRYDGYGDCDVNSGCHSGVCRQDTGFSAQFLGVGMCDVASGAICTNGAADGYDMCVSGTQCLWDHDRDDNMADCSGSNCLVASGGTADVDGDGDLDYCNAGKWDDCSTDAQCGTGSYCSAGNCVTCTSAQCATIPQCRDGTGGCCDADSDCSGNDYCDDGDNSARPYRCETPTTATRGTNYVSGGLGSSGNDFAYITTSVSPTNNYCVRYDVRDTEDTNQFDIKVNQVTRIGSPVASGNDITRSHIVYNLGSWAAGTTVTEFEQITNGHTFYNILFGWWKSETGATDGSSSSSCCDSSSDCVDDYSQDNTYGCFNSGTTRNTGGGHGADLEYCSSGTWLAADSSSTACSGVGGTWIAGGDEANADCCGDDSGEDWDSNTNGVGCCCDGSQIGENAPCPGNANKWCVDGSYCSGATARDPSQTAGGTTYTLSGDDMACGCDSSGAKCTTSGTTTANGLCASSTCVTGDTDVCFTGLKLLYFISIMLKY